jgi:hypothetical protein
MTVGCNCCIQVFRCSWLAQVGEFKDVQGSSMHEMRHQVGMGNQVFKYSALAQRGCVRAPHDSCVHAGQPCIEVFLASLGGRVRKANGSSVH